MDISIKYCSIVYHDCDQRQTQIAEGNSTPGAPNTVTLTVMTMHAVVVQFVILLRSAMEVSLLWWKDVYQVSVYHTTNNNSDENGCVIIVFYA